MKVAIVGSDQRAVAIGRLLASGGHAVSFSDPAGRERANRAAAEVAGARTETPYRQAMTHEMLVFACPRRQIDRAITAIGPSPQGVVVDALDGSPSAPHRGAELLSRKLDSHEVVRALLVLPQAGANVSICGDDAEAKKLVDEAFRASGCVTTDRGPLANAPELEPSGMSVAA